MRRPFSGFRLFTLTRPIATISAAILLTLLLFLPLGWSAWKAYQDFNRTIFKGLHLEALVGDIIRLDEVLTMSARMNAATGDTKWESRYRYFEPKLDKAIQEAIQLAPQVYEASGTEQTNDANTKLVNMEQTSFELVKRGKQAEAAALLLGKEYERQKQTYATGIERSSQAIRAQIRDNFDAFSQNLLIFSLISGLSLLALLPIWWVVLNLLRRYIRDRAIAQTALQQLNSELETRVEERTYALQESQEQLIRANQEITQFNDKLKNENLRMGAELEITRQLQQMLLPTEVELESVNGLDISGFMEPATEIGGDYYDVLQHEGRVCIGIGDVTGHGLESGVVMIMVQSAVRTLLASGETDPARFLNAVNQTIYKNTRRMRSHRNMSLVLLDYKAGILTVSGQHEELIVVRKNGQLESVDTLDLGFPLGLEQDIISFVSEIKVTLELDDVAVLYTDGITEAMNLQKEQYGLERFHQVLQTHRDRSATEIRQRAIADVMAFIGDQRVFDDITLLVLKRR